MQSSNLLSLLTLALTASAVVIQRTSPSCSNTQSLMCCNTITQQITGGQVENVGVQCNPVNVANNLPTLSGQCLGTQQLACCNTGDVTQSGAVNVNFGGICPVIF